MKDSHETTTLQTSFCGAPEVGTHVRNDAQLNQVKKIAEDKN